MNELRGLWRGKRLHNDEWALGCLIRSNSKAMILVLDENTNRMSGTAVDPSTLGECTGKRDKNGKLIFEGDIIKAIWQQLNITSTVIGIVKYDNADFILETDDYYFFFEDNIFSAECEVIGNIHDNPELLNDRHKESGNDQ